ncbi:uncharacterized protein BX663DRAFT_502686 [Cokeromyces recurvatus]|uniref:uncharacterized protein n=1 Tax=Cokeromyces recurvatus TaxID=90255 RepID=UPI00221F96FC|nr:uncharacterized protein BX663DRAFT_502686 [Cokeromyces recurvatus]KAI7904525.1 hypothetical protein BX663DRAFT_502686 [Cokeromyces recurvatus]
MNTTINNSVIAPKRKRGRPCKIKDESIKVKEEKKSEKTRKRKADQVVIIKEEKKKTVAKRKKKTTFELPAESYMYMDDDMRARVVRALKQKMFILSRELDSNDDSVEKFDVLGSIGNCYTVKIGQTISCTCMDNRMRRRHCKHILMILFKVYRLPSSSPLYHTLKTTREQRLIARSTHALVDPTVLVPATIRQRILNLTHEKHPDVVVIDDEEKTSRRPLDTSDCPICFEVFEEAKIDHIVFCQVCGNNIHDECFNMWKQSKGARNVSCVYCRSKWVFPKEDNNISKKPISLLDKEHINEGVPNFAKELGLSLVRDRSTYKTSKGYSFANIEG